MTRPNPLLWIWYTLGARLGPAYREWVLHDTTCRTRWLRQIVRVVVQVVLPAAVVLAVLGVTWIVWAAVGLGLLLALWYSLRLHQLDRGAAPREAWVRAGDTDAGAARARSPRARGSDRALQTDLSEGWWVEDLTRPSATTPHIQVVHTSAPQFRPLVGRQRVRSV